MQPEHEPASAASIDRLTETLFELAGNQHVRVIEALAAVLTRRGREGLCGRPSGTSEPARERRFASLAGDTDSVARRPICQRIARRALRGSLIDPTRGATAMHRIDVIPAWSRNFLPVGMFGPFLFYRLTPEQLRACEWQNSHDADGIIDPKKFPRSNTSDPYWWPGSASTSGPDHAAS